MMETSAYMGTGRRILMNLGHLMGGKVAAGLISLVYLAIAARTLGVAEYGMLNLLHAYVTFVGGVIAFSGYHAIVRFGSEILELGKDSHLQQLQKLFWFMAIVEFFMAAIAIAIAMAIAGYAARQMGLNAETAAFAPFYCLAILATVRTTPHGILQLAGRFDLLGIHNVIMPLVRLIGAVAVLIFGGDLTAFLWIWFLSALAEGASMWLFGFWQMRKRGWMAKPFLSARASLADHPGLVRFAAITNADITLREFAPRATPLILGWIAGPYAAGLFALASRIGAILVQPAQLLGQAGYAVVARLVAAGQRAEADVATRQSAMLVTGASFALAAAMSAFAGPILALVGGREFVSGATLLVLVLFGRALAAAAPTFSSTLTALGRPGASATASLVSNVALLPVLPLFLYGLGPNGAGWHIIAQSAILLLLLIAAYRRTLFRWEG